MIERTIRRLAAVAGALAMLATMGTAEAAAPQRATVVLAGGCFWGMEGVFESLAGVSEAMPGYAGGNARTAHYEIVSTGLTGHAESVRVTYDPARISFSRLLAVYFTVAHDPTELNRQGPDAGSQYRSEIFTTTPDQEREAKAYIAGLTARHVFHRPIVTAVEPLRGFYPAEEYHRHYMERHPDDPYIVENDRPKLAELRAHFSDLVRNGSLASRM